MASNYTEESMHQEERVDTMGLKDAFLYIRKYNIDVMGKTYTKLEELKSVIKLHAAKSRNQYKDAASMMLQQLQQNDIKRREYLFGICDQVHGLVENVKEMSELVHNQLSINLPDYVNRIGERSDVLKHDYCPIFVMGEASAGKSSFINLILGEEILPCYHLSNTAVICEIVYSEKCEATIFPWSKEKPTVIREDQFKDSADARAAFIKELAEYIQEREHRDAFKYKRARISFPCEVLKSGMCIVDSPGIGENDELTEVVLKYMFQSFAFIYIINSLNAGGLQSDRIKQLVEKLVNERKKDHGQQFLPQSAIFICNKWDLVTPKDRSEVLKDTYEKLQAIWPGFQENQVYPFSTKESLYIMKHGYTSNQFMKVLSGLQKMIPFGLEGRICFAYNYASYLIQRINIVSSTYLTQSQMSSEKRIQIKYQAEERLKKMKEESVEFFKEKRQKIKSCKDIAITKLRDYFMEECTLNRIGTFSEKDIPLMPSWKEIEISINAKTYEKILAEVSRFEEESKFFRYTKENLLTDFQTHFQTYEENLFKLENYITGRTEDDLMTHVTMKQEKSILFTLGWTRLNFWQRVAVGVMSPIVIPLALAGFVASLPVLGVMKLKDLMSNQKIKEQIQLYKQDPLSYMKQCSMEIVKESLTDYKLELLVKEELEILTMFINKLEEAEQMQRKSDEFLVDKLETEIQSDTPLLAKYKNLDSRCTQLINQLLAFKVTQMFREDEETRKTGIYDVSLERVKINKDSKTCCGLNALIYKGKFAALNDNKEVDVTIRELNSHLSSNNINNYVVEERGYRYAMRPDILKLMAVTKDVIQVYQVFEDMKCNLRDHVADMRLCVNLDWESFCLNMYKAVAKGLLFLHERRYVHYDLSLDTIAVTHDHVIKLTNISCKKTLDDVKRHVLPKPFTSQLRYIPGEVFAGQHASEYNEKADVYAFGLLVFEVLSGQLVFQDYLANEEVGIKTGQDYFNWLKNQDVCSILQIDAMPNVSESLRNVMKYSTVSDAKQRPTCKSLLSYLS